MAKITSQKAMGFTLAGLLAAAMANATTLDSKLASGVHQLLVGDYDGDQKADVLWQGRKEDEHELIRSSGAHVQRWKDGFLGLDWNRQDVNLIVGDFNGDAAVDVLLQSKFSGLMSQVMHAEFDGLFGKPVQTIGDYHQGFRWDDVHHNLIVGDFNGDMRDDVFLQGHKNSFRHGLSLASEQGAFDTIAFDFDNQHLNLDWASNNYNIFAGDFDGNGQSELLLQPKTIGYVSHINSKNGLLDTLQQSLPNDHLGLSWLPKDHRLLVGDFNGDGKDDVFLLTTDNLQKSVLIPSDGQAFPRIEHEIDFIPKINEVKDVLVGDFDADGLDDIVLVYKNGKMAALMADGARLSAITAALRGLKLLGPLASASGIKGRAVANSTVAQPTALVGTNEYCQPLSTDPNASSVSSFALGDNCEPYPDEPPIDNPPPGGETPPPVSGDPTDGITISAAPYADEFAPSSGKFRVDESGAATFSIPIAVPPGTAGVAPSLSLSYSSASGNGPLGLGWALTGLSSISRCRASYEVDGYDAPAIYKTAAAIATPEERKGIKYCFNGQRLIDIDSLSSDSSSTWVFRTEIDSFAKVTATGNRRVQPNQFVVEKKDGTRSTFGSTGDSRLLMNGGSNNGVISTWSINRFEDSVGNHITYEYSSADGEQLISHIRYGAKGAAPHSVVSFSYEDRKDKRTSYVSGSAFKQTKRLQHITVSSEKGEFRKYKLTYDTDGTLTPSKIEHVQECVGTTCAPAISFAWIQHSPTMQSEGVVGRFEPYHTGSKIGDVNGDGRPDLVSFIIDNDGDFGAVENWIKDATQEKFNQKQPRVLQPRKNYESWHVVDYNGDGRTDLLSLKKSNGAWGNWSIKLANADGSFNGAGAGGAIPGEIDTGIPNLNSATAEFADFNGDGTPDLMYQDGNPKYGTTTGWISYLKPNNRADVTCANPALKNTTANGPYCFTTPVQVSFTGIPQTLANGYKFSRIGFGYRGESSFYAANVNGDHVGDFVGEVIYGYDDPVSGYTLYHSALYFFIGSEQNGALVFSADNAYRAVLSKVDGTKVAWNRLADINGDGLVDFVATDGKVYINTAEGFVQSGDLGAMSGHYGSLQFIDLNNDGHPDAIQKFVESSSAAHGIYYVKYQLTPGAFTAWTRTNIVSRWGSNVTEMFFDVDSDGKLDKVSLRHKYSGSNEDYQVIQRAQNPGLASNAISKISLPTGAKTKILYQSLVGTGVYEKGSPLTRTSGKGSPVFDVLGPMQVVSRVESSAPTAANVDAIVAASYKYTGLKVQAGGRGSLGFQTVASKDEQTGVVTTTTYEQAFPFTGMPLKTETVLPNGRVISSAENILALYSEENGGATTYLGGDFPYVKKAIEKSKDLKGFSDVAWDPAGFIKHVETQTKYDRYGNAKEIVVSHFDENASTVKTVTTTNTFNLNNGDADLNGFYGRLNRSSVTTTTTGRGSDTRVTEYEYHPTNRILTAEIIEPDGACNEYLRTEYSLDAYGNRERTTVKSKHHKTTCSGFANGADDPAYIDRTARVEFDSQYRYPVKKYNHFGQLTEEVVSVNALHQPTTVTDITGSSTTIEYTGLGRAWKTISPTGNTVEVSLSRCDGNCPADFKNAVYYTETKSDVAPTQYEYADMLDRKVGTRVAAFNGGYSQSTIEYDILSRVKRTSLPYLSSSGGPAGWTEHEYDELGRIRQTKNPDGSINSVGIVGLVQVGTFNPNKADEHTVHKYESRNALGELIYTIDNYDGGATLPSARVNYTYDLHGRLTHLGRVNSSEYQSHIYYDRLGRKRLMWDADKSPGQDNGSNGWSYTYNALGELLSQTDPRGYTRKQHYDSLGRVTTIIDYNSSNQEIGRQTFCFNNAATAAVSPCGIAQESAAGSLGQLILESATAFDGSVQNKQSTQARSYSYDGLGRTKTINHSIESNAWYETRAYDQYGRMEVSRDITGKGLKSVFNGKFLSEIRDADDASKVHQRIDAVDARGNITRQYIGNNVLLERVYNPVTGLIESIKAGSNGSIQNLTYRWYANGNLKSRYDNTGGAALLEQFTYDKLNRLKEAIVDVASPNKNMSIEYDMEGNITSKTGVGSYVYAGSCNSVIAGPHAVTSAGGASYCYDKNGNMVSSGDGRNYTYNNTFDLPSHIQSASHETFYAYGLGNGRFKRVDKRPGETDSTVYFVGSVEVIKKTDGKTEYRRAIPNGTVNNGNISYILTDHIGSTNAVINCNGQLIQQHSFDAFGKQREPNWTLRKGNWAAAWPGSVKMLSPRNDSKTIHGFTGHEQIDELGLIHMNGRVYDPHLGRFLQADPIIGSPKSTQNLNRYSYVLNNPLSGTDPSGFDSWWVRKRESVAQVVAIVISIYCMGTCTNWLLAAVQYGMMGRNMYYAHRAGELGKAVGLAVFSYYLGKNMGPSFADGAIKWDALFGNAMFGGVMAELGGGKFGHGFVVAGLSSLARDYRKFSANNTKTGWGFSAEQEAEFRKYGQELRQGAYMRIAGNTLDGMSFKDNLLLSVNSALNDLLRSSVGLEGTIDVPASLLDDAREIFGFERRGVPDFGISVSIQATLAEGGDLGMTLTRRAYGSYGIGRSGKFNASAVWNKGSIAEQAGSGYEASIFVWDAGATYSFDKNFNITGVSVDAGAGISVGTAVTETATLSFRHGWISLCDKPIC